MKILYPYQTAVIQYQLISLTVLTSFLDLPNGNIFLILPQLSFTLRCIMLCLDILIEFSHFLLKKNQLPKKIAESKIIFKKLAKVQSNMLTFHRCLVPQQSSKL